MNSNWRSVRLVAAVAVVAMIFAACGSSKDKTKATTGGSQTTKAATIVDGGTLTVGAEQEPECFDWLDACASSSWGAWMGQYQTIPRVFDPIAQADGSVKNVPSNLVTGAPEFSATPVETITYSINPKAVWSDGTAITCADFKYTVDQQQNTSETANLYDTTGYVDIDKVDCTDPAKPIVTYKAGKTYASWQVLFGGGVGLYPSHLLEGKDRHAIMKDSYGWSGGPWIASWTKGDNITLTRNDKYWGQKSHLDKVVFKFTTDTAAEFLAFKSNQVQAIYPQPQLDVVDAMTAGIPGATTLSNAKTAYVEALWINNSKFPFDSKAVRQAFAYAIDRDAIVKQLFGKLGVDKAVNSLNPFAVADYSDQTAWSTYKLDLDKVTSLMEGDGWAKGSDQIWAKGGKKASFTMLVTQGNKRRELVGRVAQSEAKAAGFDLKLKSQKAGDFSFLQPGDFTLALFANGLTGLTPGQCSSFCSKNIPTPANGQSGGNYYRVDIPALDPLLETGDTSLDDAARRQAGKDADKLMAENQVTLPLDPLPDILIWSKKVVGPVSDNSILGMFWNINEWGCVNANCAG